MLYFCDYMSPIGKLKLVSKDSKLVHIYLKGYNIKEEAIEKNDEEILVKSKEWLDRYFNGCKPKIEELNFEFVGSEFEINVWNLLCEIPYGELTTYGDLAKKICKIMNKDRMSSQAIENAVGKNPLPIVVPCHRVVGTNGNLTGYTGGLDIKVKLLELEKVDMSILYLPKRSVYARKEEM